MNGITNNLQCSQINCQAKSNLLTYLNLGIMAETTVECNALYLDSILTTNAIR